MQLQTESTASFWYVQGKEQWDAQSTVSPVRCVIFFDTAFPKKMWSKGEPQMIRCTKNLAYDERPNEVELFNYRERTEGNHGDSLHVHNKLGRKPKRRLPREGLESLLSETLKPNWTRSWAACSRWPCWSWMRCPPELPPTSAVLWNKLYPGSSRS